MDSKSVYDRKVIQHRFIQDAYDTIEQTEHGGSIVITGPHNDGEDSDIEVLDDTEMDEAHNMPNEVAGELDVFIDGESSDSDEEEVIREPSKKKAKGIHMPKWKLGHIRSSEQNTSKENRDPGKVIMKVCPELENLSEFELYKKVFGEMANLIITESNRYANRDKNNPSFELTEETFWNFFGLLLLSGYNIRSSERDYWSKSPDLACTLFIETMSRKKNFIEIEAKKKFWSDFWTIFKKFLTLF